MSYVSITLPTEQAHVLCTLLHNLRGQLQYRAINIADTPLGRTLDDDDDTVLDIALAVATPLGRCGTLLDGSNAPDNPLVDRLLKVVRREA